MAVPTPTMNGTGILNGHADSEELVHLTKALDVIYDPYSSNHARREATEYLEQIKTLPDAASRGFVLASDQTRSAASRHFGLSLLTDTVKYKCDHLGRLEQRAVRDWVTRLAEAVEEADPAYLRNKVAQLWFESARKFWLDQWHTMDELLVQLWNKSFTHQAVVLNVLEALSDDSFSKEDVSSPIKSAEMGKACVEIFTSSEVLAQAYPDRDIQNKFRFQHEGWFTRLLNRIDWCLGKSSDGASQVKSCLLQCLQVLRSVITWIVLRAVSTSRCIDLLCRLLQAQDIQLQIAVLEVFHGLYHRTQYIDDEVRDVVYPMLRKPGLDLLRSVYDGSRVQPDAIDEHKYLLSKKLTEVLCALGCFIEQRPLLVTGVIEVPAAFDFFAQCLRNDSLVVSIPILYMWTKLLACKDASVAAATGPFVETLLEVSSQRLLKYESLSEDSNDATLQYLDEDFDTMPERHAFVGNYRRFCTEVIERIVRKTPFEAMHHILQQADRLFDALPGDVDGAKYSSDSIFALSVDAQCTVITSAVKGYVSGRTSEKAKAAERETAHQQLQHDIEQWCTKLLERDILDPAIQKRALQLCSELTSHVLSPDTNVPLAIGQRSLSQRKTARIAESTAYGEALKDLYSSQARILQKLSMKFPNKFMPVLDEVQQEIERIALQADTDQRAKMELRVVPFIVIHRTNLLSREEKQVRLSAIVDPVLGAWQAPDIAEAVTSFDSFCTLLGVDRIPQYFLTNGAHTLEDWSTQPLGEEGLALRDDITRRAEELPLQSLKSLLMAATDRIRHGAEDYLLAAQLWEPSVPIVLPKVLQLVSHAHAFGNPRKWSCFPDEMQIIVQRTLVDRVWQSGISSESRDDFYNRVRQSKKTLEGLASATRAAIRGVRELSYWVLHCMCQFGESFYSHVDLAEPLAKALYENADSLSSHQVSTLLRISMALIDGCPLHHRQQFLPPLISSLYRQVDRKLTTEWELLGSREEHQTNDETLDAEMKIESVLRQLTFSAATLASSLISLHIEPYTGPPMRGLTLSSPAVLSSLVVFCNHVLRMRDTRSCSLVTRIMRSIIPEFTTIKSSSSRPSLSDTGEASPASPHLSASTAAQIREFFCSDVLKGAITSLHEPYFADLQKELGALIGCILYNYSKQTITPRNVLQSLPGMSDGQIDRALDQIAANQGERHQRTIVLTLLEGLRGVSIHEMGKIISNTPRRDRVGGKTRTAMQEQFANMAVDAQPSRIDRGGSAEIEGMGQLFE